MANQHFAKPVTARPRLLFLFVFSALLCLLTVQQAPGLHGWYSLLRAPSQVPEKFDHVVEDPVAPHEGSRVTFTETSEERQAGQEYLLGVGKGDITGPVVELNFMGYANGSQDGTGVRQRLYARSFIIGDPDDTANRFVYVVLDTQSGDTAIRNGILDGLAALGSDYSMYGQSNVAIIGTHSHSGPGGWLNYLLPQVTNLGFDKESYQAIVNGTVLAIQRAHESTEAGTLTVGTTDIDDANISRSLWAYLANPESERAEYSDSVDKTMTLLRFTRSSDGLDIGVLSWFAVHGTSMLGNNTIVTGDNKGVAAYLFEQAMNSTSTAAEGFVAGFSQANVGDTSPNINGAWCEDGSGEMCTLQNSTCGGTSEACHGRGPYFGLNDGGTKSCFEIGRRQYAGALDIYNGMTSNSSSTAVTGSTIRAFHTFVDYSNYQFPLSNGTIVRTCPAAMGYSFAAGTTDGPGEFDFTQNDSGTPDANPLWAVVSGLLKEANETQKECQSPKPILLDTGEMSTPYQWSPNIVDIQMLRVGNLIMIISPGEATTMSGRRWRNAISSAASSQLDGGDAGNFTVVLGGPANSYCHYIATPEEYGVQRYEGASTLHGPYTLDAYINLTVSNIEYLSSTVDYTDQPPAGPSPPDNRNNSLSFITGVVYDYAGLTSSFGDVVTDANATYSVGDTVAVSFVGANPRNNLRLEGTYAAVEQLSSANATWTSVRTDEDWALLFEWTRTNSLLGTSQVDISWETDVDSKTVESGTYRIKYYGDSKALGGAITAFEGTSGQFTIS